MINSEVLQNARHYDLSNFKIETLRLESHKLAGNPLKDPTIRFNPALIPLTPGPWPVVLVLGGFTGNAPFYFNAKFNELNAVQGVDQGVTKGEAPEALYVFVDALTSWGGSQFLNSAATGDYEDYIVQELVPLIKKTYSVSSEAKEWCVMGGSSGGYGALHLSSKFPDTFGVAGAIAPDSFFEASITSDLYQALPFWEKYQSGLRVLEDLRNGRLKKFKNWHSLLNAFGMSACYSAKGSAGDFDFPLDNKGLKKEDIWKKWLSHDPLHFLPQRLSNLKKLSGIYLDVGTKDNFHLQYGARQIASFLKENSIDHSYVEFDGNHFDIGDRRPEVWKYLQTIWRK